jgi:ABC-type polysaccharide/polyol phosphate export permease
LFASLRRLFGYRALIQSLVVRDLKARYRGSVLGFFWSFVNPLLLLTIYTFVFTRVLKTPRDAMTEPYPLFIFCGLLPWTWFSSSLLESSTVLIAGGNLIRKVLFPADVLPVVSVLAALVHFCLGLLIVGAAIGYFGVDVVWVDLLWLPVVIAVQLVLTLGLALFVSAFTVHFRDLRDLLANLLTLWFFATPIIYPMSLVPAEWQPIVRLNPFTHLAVAYQEILFLPGPYRGWPRLLVLGGGAIAVFLAGYFFFDRLRDTFAEAA